MAFAGKVLRREPAAAPAPQTDYNSPGFRAIAERLQSEEKCTILELGPAAGPSLEFFSQFACKLHVYDISDAVEQFNARTEEGESLVEAAIGTLLDFDSDVRFDIILAWDIFNYLDSDVAQALSAHLSSFSAPDASLFTLVCTGARQPDVPSHYRILGSDQLRYVIRSEGQMDSPRMAQHEVQKRLSGFTRKHTWLLQNSVQEYLFRY